MDLIVTHNNADFDAFASLVAAKKLYPNSRLLLPGSQQRAVREILALVKDKMQIENERTCDLSDIERLVIVDTRHKSRIGIAAHLLADSSVETHIYDHHPKAPNDIKAEKDVFQEVGATVSIIVDMLRRKKSVKFTPLEATIMLLAIYEETGSLTYRTTTRLDVDTVSFLLSKGANLGAISSYLKRNLTEEELTFLTALIGSTKILTINGINIAVARGTITHFIGELGTIVRKLQDVENFPVLFALFKTKTKLRVIARSRLKEVDVNKILREFGGGGHKSAASAKIENTDFESFEEKLTRILRSNIKAKILAKDLMSSPVRFIPAGKNIKDAKKILGRFSLKGAPVMEGGRLIGIIAMADIKKALKNRYGHASVKGYMSRTPITVAPDTPIHAIQRLMFEKGIGRIPVINNKKLIGIVTRTDVLKSVHRDIFGKGASLKRKRARFNVSTKMKRVLPKEILNILRTIGHCANRKGFRAFVVGGFVRDILLGVRNLDVDIVVEGNAILLARDVARRYKAGLVVYRKFGTATVVTGKFKIDFATARKETYAKPAALPSVKFSSLKNDLERRDFTINAMASSLEPRGFGSLIDFFGGEKDLENGVIRALHDSSFIDDPTRIFRAVRFEQRFGFRIDEFTENLIKHAIREGMFSKTQNQRIRDELMLMLREKEPMRAISRMRELDELRFIHKKIAVRNSTRRLFAGIRDLYRKYMEGTVNKKHVDLRLIYLMALMENLKFDEVKTVCEKFVFRRRDRIRLLSCKKNKKKTLRALSAGSLSPSGVYRALRPLSPEEILYIAAGTEKKVAVSRIMAFLKHYSNVKIKIGGRDLKKLGIEPGPLYSRILAKVLDAKIDGKLRTKKDELAFVRGHLRGQAFSSCGDSSSHLC